MSTPALNICHKNQLWTLVKKVGEHYKEDLDFLKEYAKEVYEGNEIMAAIECFKDLLNQVSPESFKL